MMEYALTVFAVCVIFGLLCLFSYGSGGAEKMALGIITLYLIIAPIVIEVGNIDLDGLFDKITTPDYETNGGYAEIAEDAFAEGIVKAVAEEFSLDKSNIRVRLYDFDFDKMQAKNIVVILSGRAAMADYRAVDRYVNQLEIGVCKVEIEIG